MVGVSPVGGGIRDSMLGCWEVFKSMGGRGRNGPFGPPPHGSQRAELPHWAPTSGSDAQTLLHHRCHVDLMQNSHNRARNHRTVGDNTVGTGSFRPDPQGLCRNRRVLREAHELLFDLRSGLGRNQAAQVKDRKFLSSDSWLTLCSGALSSPSAGSHDFTWVPPFAITHCCFRSMIASHGYHMVATKGTTVELPFG